MRIGGTGILSTEVCRLAIEKGFEVYTVNRGHRTEFLNSSAINMVADVLNSTVTDLKNTINIVHYDVVVDFVSRDIKQLKRIVEVVGENCTQFFFISSASCYKEVQGSHLYREDDDIHNDVWDYCVRKAECEDYLTRGKWSFRYTIVRPYVTYSQSRIPFQVAPLKYYTIIYRMKNKKPIIMAKSDAVCTLTNVRDFAVGVVGLMNNPKAYDEAFHITSDHTYTWGEVKQIIEGAIGAEAEMIEISADTMKTFRNPGFEVEELLGDKTRNMVFDNRKIKNAVPEYRGDISFEDGIQASIDFFSKSQHQIVDYLWDGRIDRIIAKSCRHGYMRLPRSSAKNTVMYLVGRLEPLYRLAKLVKRKHIQ